ncbi:hypothetical protein EVAR_29512_1 [Eumeta japonica]|uniref:Uncharacterized protein n=1 Tax=Eumeta variegata TaxID=151549 RepID=A0A4C1WHQ9_EUMVA|nr:hypothetical protein EVAR_29512_1 [Eumeta japonica]
MIGMRIVIENETKVKNECGIKIRIKNVTVIGMRSAVDDNACASRFRISPGGRRQRRRSALTVSASRKIRGETINGISRYVVVHSQRCLNHSPTKAYPPPILSVQIQGPDLSSRPRQPCSVEVVDNRRHDAVTTFGAGGLTCSP